MHAGTGVAGAAFGGVDERSLRLLRRAIAGSVALHALLLAALPLLREPGPLRAPAPPALTAHLAKPPPPPPPKVEAPVPPPRVAAPKPAPVPPPASAPAPRPAPMPVLEPVKPAAAVAPTVPVPPPVVAAPAAVAAPTLVAPLPAPRSEAAAFAPASPAVSGPDPGSVARFRMELMEVARRYKRYPRIAQDNGWEGRVEVRIAYAESGAIASVTVKKGAGRQVLDDEALAMIRNAQSQVAVPPSLRGRAFVLEIPVDFFLRDDAR